MKQYLPVNKSTGQVGYYSGNNPSSLSFIAGSLPAARQWRNYGNYIDVTDSVDEPEKLKLTWTLNRDNFGEEVPDGGIASKKSASGALLFEGEAFQLLKNWLIDDVSASLNVVQVMIEYVGCGRFTDYQITANDITYCEDAVCTFSVTLKQLDLPLDCIKRTIISDNWQGWFQSVPANGKKHPRFSYCKETKPNLQLAVQMALAAHLGAVAYILLILVGPPLLVILAVVLALATVINAIISAINTIPGINIPTFNTSGLQNAINQLAGAFTGGLFDWFANLMLEMVGCGREHPAPLIRDYISNVCAKCGVRVDAQTAPVFFSNIITWSTSSRGVLSNAYNEHYNACFLYTENKRGIRRFLNFNINGNEIPSNEYYIPETRPLDTLDMFLDRLKGLYNFEWELKYINNSGQLQPTLYIQRKDYFKQPNGTGYLFDFSVNGADRSKLIKGICYEWNGQKQPAFIRGLYEEDAIDSCGNEAKHYFNDIVTTGNVDINPNFDGTRDKTQRFGATRFRLDGVSNDYVYDALQIISNVSFLSLFLNLFILARFRDQVALYGDYALLMNDETCALPKVLLWDGNSYENAKCSRRYFATSNNGVTPAINNNYNTDAHTWEQRHKPETYVKGYTGSLANPFNQPYGTYRVQDLLGTITIVRPAMLPNYHISFAQDFQDSMWDYFHWIDDPKFNPVINQNFNLRIPLCCEDAKTLKIFNDGGAIELGGKVKLSNPYNPDGKITEITASWDTEDVNGQYIEIKGQL